MSTVHEVGLLMALTGKSKEEALKEVTYDEMFKAKCDYARKAFGMRHDDVTITQEEADELNKQFQEIINYLECNGSYDYMEDYIIDFDSFVKDNESFRRFCW